MQNRFHHHLTFSLPRRILFLLLVAAFAVTGLAQSGDRDARTALWDSYKLAEGKFVRFVDRDKGFSFWHPENWKESASERGHRYFKPAPEGVNLFVLTDDIPEGYGIANYAGAFMQGIRDQPIHHDSVTVRRVMACGLEWRELSYDLETPGGGIAHQTVWITAAGARVYGFVLTAAQDELDQYEPILKRVVMTAQLGLDGFRREEFETVRAKFAAETPSLAASELTAAVIADDLRMARQNFDAAVQRVNELFGKSPDSAFDLLIDADPQVRAAAIAALGKTRQNALGTDALIWALSDSDALASATAAANLAARGTTGLAALKSKLSVPRALTPAAIVRAAIAFGPQVSRELIAEMLAENSANLHLAALQLALSQERFDAPLPYAKLFNSHQTGVLHATVAVSQRYRKNQVIAELSPELVKMLRGDAEVWAARTLGEIAPIAVAAELEKRIAEIDARLAALGKSDATTPGKTQKSGQPAKPDSTEKQTDPFSLGTLVDLKTKPEDVRLAVARGQLELAVRKIKFRECLNTIKVNATCIALIGESNKSSEDLDEWANSIVAADDAKQPAATFDVARFANAPTTGETLFPKNTISYVMSPNFAATMEKLDTALSGVQMATVRDQMTLALILKMLKTTLADKTGSSQTGDSSKATGIDLQAPMSLATWPGSAGKDVPLNSAIVLRVNDRARFERSLMTFQNEIGDMNAFSTATAALSRFAGLVPAAVPVIMAAAASERTRGDLANTLRGSSSSKPAAPSLKPFTLISREAIGGVPITVFDKQTITDSGVVNRELIFLAFLGETAIVSSSREALIDALTTAQTGQSSIAQSEGFAKVRKEKGEIVFFSDLPSLLESAFSTVHVDDESLKPILKLFGAESGALNITPNSWQTTFNIGLAENEFTASFQPFKVDSLMAPRDLLPQSTVLYAGAMVEPPKMLSVLKKLGATSGSATGTSATESARRDKLIEDAIEKQLVPQMKGEIGAAIVSFKPLFESNELPSMVFAAKLKSGMLAAELRSEKFFPGFKRVANSTALGSAIVALGENNSAPFAAVTRDYFLLADSVETLKRLEAKEKFSSSRDFVRAAQNMPNNLALFATYNLESAFEEASTKMADAESQQALAFLSALVHAFHSQRVFVTLEKDGQTQFLNGHLSVAFDREGRFSVGELAGRSTDFDVANALVPAKGLSVVESPRVEAMTLRVTAKRPGIASRVGDDLSKFPFQKIEASNDSSIVVATSARRIPEDSTVQLPVSGAEFAQYLAATPQINSKAPQIIALGKQISGDDKDGRSVARKIGEWTHQNLKWKKVQSDAVETLASREADCLEHSELYVALARSLGLPARVVSGAALSGGSFGAHAWVEIYLGKWVEIDPTWGLMDHVDATHLRFDGDAFTSYAMLNQIELEVTAARRTIAEYQRDPVQLVKEFSLDASTRGLAFDLSLTVEQALGAEKWSNLDDKQRAVVIKAFERTVAGMWETWNEDLPEPIRVIRNEAKASQKILTVLRGEGLFRMTLTPRDGAWFITEHESLDDAHADFADALSGALSPETRRGRVYEVSLDGAMKHLDRIIAAEGEKPELLLLKSRILLSQRNEAYMNAALKQSEEKKEEADAQPLQNKYIALLKQIASRWPNFAPGQLALGRELISSLDEGALSSLSQDTESGIAALKSYAQLVPDDPRVWRELAQTYEHLEKAAEAEAAYRTAIRHDSSYLEHHSVLVNFLLNQEQLEKAKAAFAQMLKVATDADEVFEYLDDEEGFDADSAKIREDLLKAFPKEVGESQAALRLLADLQEAQNKTAEAIKSTLRSIAIEATTNDYESLSRLYRQQRRFAEALAAANNVLKLDDSATEIQFERACSLAQLGRKREAVAALKEAMESDLSQFFDLDEPDLKPLATVPEFKAIKEKQKEALKPAEEIPDGQGKPAKPKTGNP